MEFLRRSQRCGASKLQVQKMVAGLLPITSGELTLEGQPINGPQKDVGIVFQSAVLLAWRTVFENIMLQAEMRHMPQAEATAKANQLIEMAGLKGFEGKYPRQLSGGMQQRASICRALLHDPSLLLMDEPFGALDAQTRLTMQELLLNVWQQLKPTIIFVTHDIDEAIFLASTIYVMSARPGRIQTKITVPLDRPRTVADTASETFAALKLEILNLIRH